MPMKTFRGKLAHDSQDTIRLGTNNGLTGYQITLFDMMPVAPGAQSNESVVKVFKRSQSTIDGTIDFDDNALLAAGFLAENGDARFHVNPTVVFDNEIFNQDIYITYFDVDGANGEVNYYLELKQVKLDLNEATVATLKDMRGSN